MNEYECIINYNDKERIHVKVFARNEVGLKQKAHDRAAEFLKELGHVSINEDSIKPIGFINKGKTLI